MLLCYYIATFGAAVRTDAATVDGSTRNER